MPKISELTEQYYTALDVGDLVPVVSTAMDPDTTCKVQLQTLANFFFPPGSLMAFAFSGPPEGWLLCNGAAVSRATYANLFNAIGTTWGAGDGTTTFNVPDLRGRVPLSRGQGSGLTNRTLGSTGGAETHTLVTAEIPAHTHPATMTGFYGAGAVAWTAGPYAAGQLASGSTGGGGAHANMQPWSCVSWCVKV